MTIQNPLQCIDPKNRKKVLIFLLLAILSIFSIFRFLDAPLQTKAAPAGIVSFELAGNPEKAGQILASWNSHANLFAAFGLGFDYLFMLVYATCISLACLMASNRKSGWFSSLGAWLGWGAFLAVLLDATENIALWNLLNGNGLIAWPEVAAWCASIKFALILSGILYALIGWILQKINL
ncbi:MAG: hypothetical protein A2X25_03915 [Chloroflexi bacterium GWB2_49_20]|nr:MAG: hypothetical protein A2X25_03915 [Chloroflexi bacterium GWB2_49_20]OGN76730.1 MAG: hypothetical protein A2X26_11005 [Chloroflexi bacterium GWC2_49_37]OGN83690.1 MAG: hypothetical protein A2X27_01660 [Chloroflexi bacterium GWD2_49_16]HBG74187.1 hypothetical protein [Anaerolineae bacterium]HCC78995.1 hypothetical protein [Anaerolineae bacterium]